MGHVIKPIPMLVVALALCALSLSLIPAGASAGYCQTEVTRWVNNNGISGASGGCKRGAATLQLVGTCRREVDGRYPYNLAGARVRSYNGHWWTYSAIACKKGWRVSGARIVRFD